MSVLVTGAAGFIGFHTARALLKRGETVVGIDNLTPYYDVRLKQRRIAELERDYPASFAFLELDFADNFELRRALDQREFDRIIHLGAQPGVRYSLENPGAYIHSNVVGHTNMLEIARSRSTAHFVYASSSSVYGVNESLPFRVEDRADRPVSLYAATKRTDELISESYAHLFRIPMTGLRFFTVYGPWGRPDMAMWIFTKAILEGTPLMLFNGGEMRRDFTYIDDVVAGIRACLDSPPQDDRQEKPGGSFSPHAVYNIGNHRSEELVRVVDLLEQAIGRKAEVQMEAMQPGDVRDTYADISAIQRDHGFAPLTRIDEGIPRFVEWYKAYHGLR